MIITPPAQNDYPQFYHTYVSKVNTTDLIPALSDEMQTLKGLLTDLSDEKSNYRYQPDKWNIKELLIHMCDTERIFSYRALRFARHDKTALPGFEQDDYGQLIWGTNRSVDHILAEFQAVRESSIKLYESFGEEELNCVGVASGADFTVRAQGYITLGHALHHRLIIEERYLNGN